VARAGGRALEAHQTARESRLSRAGLADESDALARKKLERDAADGLVAVEALVQRVDSDEWWSVDRLGLLRQCLSRRRVAARREFAANVVDPHACGLPRVARAFEPDGHRGAHRS